MVYKITIFLEDRMATEKLAEGIRTFAKDIENLA